MSLVSVYLHKSIELERWGINVQWHCTHITRCWVCSRTQCKRKRDSKELPTQPDAPPSGSLTLLRYTASPLWYYFIVSLHLCEEKKNPFLRESVRF